MTRLPHEEAVWSDAAVRASPTPERRPIGVVCALDWELAHLKARLQLVDEDRHAGRTAALTRLGAQPLVLVASGMGMLMSAAATEWLIGRHQPLAVLNYGCAGAHRADLLPGDLVVGTRTVAYDNIRETPSGEQRYTGMHLVRVGVAERLTDVASDPRLVGSARAAAERVLDAHEPWPLHLGWPTAIAHRGPRVVFGTVASADRWNRSPPTIARLVSEHDSVCEDMEAAAIALVCAAHQVPFLTLKDISNNELLRHTASGTAMLAEIGPDQLARRAAAFAFEVLRELG